MPGATDLFCALLKQQPLENGIYTLIQKSLPTEEYTISYFT